MLPGIDRLSKEELLSRGSISCAGCGCMLALRHTLKVLGRNTIFVNSTGCAAVVMQMGVPKVPHFHTLFENGPAVASGIDAALRVMGKREGVNVLVYAGDGATADIGLGSLSGAIERGQRIIYVCYDNESYMNTGGQRSGTTPAGAATTTTPVGRLIKGEPRPQALRKDLPAIFAAHNTPYVATASVSHLEDYAMKLRKAAAVDGPSFVYIYAPCPTGWGFDPAKTVHYARMAVGCGLVTLFEIEGGRKRITLKVDRPEPVSKFMEGQRRFAHIEEKGPNGGDRRKT